MKHYFSEDNNIKLFHGDCLEIMDKLIENGVEVDCVVCDPPYRVISGGKPKTKGQPSGILSKNDGKIFEYNNLSIQDYLPRVYKLLKDGTQSYLMVNFSNLSEFLIEIEKAGFQLHNLLVWKKNNCTPNRWYMKNAEYIIFFRKGKAKAINNVGSKTVIDVNNIIGNKLHPSEKPIELMELFIGNSTNEHDIVLDFTMGSGSTGVACKNLNRRFIGIELDEKYFDIAVQRIKEEL